MGKKVRVPLFDVVKAVLMYFVILGHLPVVKFKAAEGAWNIWLWSGITAVSMPLFFMISGMFARSMFDRRDGLAVARRLIGLLLPALVCGLFFGLVIGLQDGRGVFWVLSYPFQFFMLKIWFVRTMFCVLVLTSVVWLPTGRICLRLVLAIIVYLGLLFRPAVLVDVTWWLDECVHMWPYFLFGLFAMSYRELQSKASIAIPSLIMATTLIAIEVLRPLPELSFYHAARAKWVYWKSILSTRESLFCFFARPVLGVCSGIFLLWLIRVLMLGLPKLAYLSPLGTTTLGVYVMHEGAFRLLGPICHVEFPHGMGYVAALGALLLFHLITRSGQIIAAKIGIWYNQTVGQRK